MEKNNVKKIIKNIAIGVGAVVGGVTLYLIGKNSPREDTLEDRDRILKNSSRMFASDLVDFMDEYGYDKHEYTEENNRGYSVKILAEKNKEENR